MSIFIPEEENIYFPKTREYFKEVMSSYSNGNYRSALVMLYSVVICDMLFKLQELKDMYNDSIASSILEKYENSVRESKKGSKSAWEKEFIDKIYNDTELLDLEAYTHLNHLYDDRNFSAHPALDREFELISPSKETTLCHIKNALTDILTKPPLFLKNVVNTLTEDLDRKKDIFKGNKDDLKAYLENRYFSKMSNPMRLKVLKAFWKFVFVLDDEKCVENRNINRNAIEFLVKNSNESIFKLLKDEGFSFDVNNDIYSNIQLVIFLANYPQAYKFLNDTTLLQLKKSYEEKKWLKFLNWYEFKSLKKHLEYLYEELEYIPDSLPDGTISFIVENYKDANMYSELLDYFIFCFGNSKNFDMADWNYQYIVKPFLKDFSKKQYIDIIKKIDDNNQLYNRFLAITNNTELYTSAIELYGKVFNIDSYKNFSYKDDEIIKQEPEEIIDEYDDLPF